jgi:hypothetical protein
VGQFCLTWNNASTADETGGEVVDDGAVQVGHDHHVELVRVRDELHAGVVDNHILRFDHGVQLRHLSESSQEQAVALLHDVRLVDARDLLSAVSKSEVESELNSEMSKREQGREAPNVKNFERF